MKSPLSPPGKRPSPVEPVAEIVELRDARKRFPAVCRRWCAGGLIFFAALSALSPIVSPFFHTSIAALSVKSSRLFPGWAAAPIPQGLSAIALDTRTARFATEFPGRIGAFSDGARIWIVRWVVQPTRKLHPSTDCLRATGYHVEPAAAYADSDGTLWSTSLAEREHERWRVRERLVATQGVGAWTDVSAWYWQNLWSRSPGPWWAVTLMERSFE